jgi:large subunit ribosomal protein L17
MRHRVGGTKFNVDKDHRDSLLKNLLTSYIDHEQMVTTEAKAKALKSMFDKIVTRAKKNDLQARRLIGSMITKKDVLMKLFDTLLPRFAGRSSGYSTTTLIVGERSGDSAKMMKIAMILDPVAEIKEEKKTTRKKATKKSEASEEVTA